MGAIDAVHNSEWGRMISLRGNHIITVPLTEALHKNKRVDDELINVAAGLYHIPQQKGEPVLG